jgi:hypothetical protein
VTVAGVLLAAPIGFGYWAYKEGAFSGLGSRPAARIAGVAANGVAGVAASAAAVAKAESGYKFIVYGDSRAGSDCNGNAVHIGLIKRMAAANPVFVVNTGDMITGFAKTTNFIEQGDCPLPDSLGSLKRLLAPLQERTPPPGLKTTFFPVVGNHDDNWGSKWYPDPFKNGFCDAFDPKILVPNHTTQAYATRPKAKRFSDKDFYALTCSTTSQEVYPWFLYYSFDYLDTHFLVLRVNSNYFNIEESYNIHQLDFVRADLAAARKNPKVKSIYVFLHAPIFGSGPHPNNASSRVLAGVFTEYGVKAVFSGHNHLYERSVPVAMEPRARDGVRDDAKGTVYVVTGGGGSELHRPGEPAWYSVIRKATYHYVEVIVDGSAMRVRAIDSDGKVIDEFSR